MKKLVNWLFYYIIKYLNFAVLKKDNVIFTSSPSYSDNSLAVFEKMYQLHLFEKYIWLLEKKFDIKRYDNVIYVNRHSLKGIYYFFTSKYIVNTHGLYLNAYSDKQVVFCVWHGMPLKKIQHLFPEDLKNIANRNFEFDLTIATSSLMQKIVSQCFNCSIDKVKLTGLPRNDYLFAKLKFNNLPDNSKVIVWMPTYRNGNNLAEGKQYEYGLPIVSGYKLKELDKCCVENNVHIIIKLHPLQKKNKEISGFSNIHLLSSNYVDMSIHFYNYLGSADALITDYSSVYIDFLAVDKPIGFILEDYKEYGNDRGFVFDNPLTYMPGCHIYDIEDLKKFIVEISNGIDSTKELRNTIGIQLNQFRDNKNTERFVNEIIPVLLKDGKES